MSGPESSVKSITIFVLLVGGTASLFLSVALSLNYLLTFFGKISTLDKLIGYGVLAGPLPLIAGTVMILFKLKQKPAVWLVMLGSVILTAWLIALYVKAVMGQEGFYWWEKLIWFVLVPGAVVATDIVSFRLYRLIGSMHADQH